MSSTQWVKQATLSFLTCHTSVRGMLLVLPSTCVGSLWHVSPIKLGICFQNLKLQPVKQLAWHCTREICLISRAAFHRSFRPSPEGGNLHASFHYEFLHHLKENVLLPLAVLQASSADYAAEVHCANRKRELMLHVIRHLCLCGNSCHVKETLATCHVWRCVYM